MTDNEFYLKSARENLSRAITDLEIVAEGRGTALTRGILDVLKANYLLLSNDKHQFVRDR